MCQAVIIAGIVGKRDQDLSRARLWRRGIDLEASIDACPQFKGRNLRRGPLLWLGPTQRGGQELDAKVRELTIIALVSCFSLGLACAYEADFFAIFFATAAAIAGIGGSTITVTPSSCVHVRKARRNVHSSGAGSGGRVQKRQGGLRLCLGALAAPLHRLGNWAPSSGPSFSCGLPSLR